MKGSWGNPNWFCLYGIAAKMPFWNLYLNGVCTPKAKQYSIALLALNYLQDIFCNTHSNKKIKNNALLLLIQPDVSISSLLIGLRDNASCKFPARVDIFQLARKTLLRWISRSRQSLHPICVKCIAVKT